MKSNPSMLRAPVALKPSLSAMRRSPLYAVIFGALACLGTSASLAQDAAATDKPKDAATTDKTVLDTVIVTANKRVEDIRKVGAAISVITDQQLEDIHATQLSDYANYVPGLQVTSNGTPGKTTVTMRGIGPLSSGSTVGFYIDEVPLGSSGVYQAAIAFALDLLPYDIEQVEVLRGPQGTLYGAGSMGGLLKYVMRAPDPDKREFRFGAGISSVDGAGSLGYDTRFSANVPLAEDRAALRFSYSHNDLPGYIDNWVDGEEDINAGSQSSARASFLWRGDAVNVSLTAMQQNIDSDNNAIVALDPTTLEPLHGDMTNELYVDEPFSKDVDFFSATIDWDLGWGNFVSATGYSDGVTKVRSDTTILYGEFANLVLGLPESGSSFLDNGYELTKFTQEFRLMSKSDGPFEWLLGAFYTKEEGENTQYLELDQLDGSPLPPPYDFYGVLARLEIPSDFREWAVFANGSYQFSDRFKLDAGVRFSSNDQNFSQAVTEGVVLPIATTYNSSSEDVFTWSLTPQFQVSEDVMVYGKVATGYQPGGPNVLVAGLPPTVDSSTLTSYELGMKSQFADNRVSLDLVAFKIDWEDIQVITQVNNVGGLVNGGKATSRGVELAGAFKATERLQLGLNATYTNADLTDDFPTVTIPSPPYVVELTTGLAGDMMPYVPEFAWSATADYSFPLGATWSGHVGGGFVWVDDRPAGTTNQEVIGFPTNPITVLQTTITPPHELPSYHSLDLYANASNANWTLRFYAKNVTDQRAYSQVTDLTSLSKMTSIVKGAPIQPRTLGFEVDYSF